ncbi:MAG: FMN-binding protein [Candidatus Latescibacteria bacterium]|nr:FMN-binding protein [Candidatus Latescibacterota bacterium]
MRGGYIGQAWLVILLSLCFGGLLAGIEIQLGERIAENKRAATRAQIPALVPGAVRGEEVVVDGSSLYRAVGVEGPVGWVLPGRGAGFADQIEILIGLDAGAQTITGLYVLEQKETPGLGNKIEDGAWRQLFVGRAAGAPLTVVRPGTQGDGIDAITGATISSESVCQIANETLARLRPQLAGRMDHGR